MAYRRYVENEKADIKKNKDMINIGSEIEKMKTDNVHLREKLKEQEKIKNGVSSSEETTSTPGNLSLSATNGNSSVSWKYFLCVLKSV